MNRLDRPEVRISDPGEVAAALPHLLGFRPRESIVLIALGGPSGGRVELTARGDIPPPGYEWAAARMLTESLLSVRPAAALVVLVSEAPDEPAVRWCEEHAPDDPDAEPTLALPHGDLLHEVVLALDDDGVPVRDALLVRGGRWWSYDCPHPCCAPGAGTPLPGEATVLAAASVVSGQVVARDREELYERLDPPEGTGPGMADAALRAVRACYAKESAEGRAALAEESWALIEAAHERYVPGGQGAAALDDDEIARLLCGLRDRTVRDRAMGFAIGEAPAAAEALWTECTRRAPGSLAAAPATLLAVSAWLRGDGAMASVALEHALAAEPGYRLAELLTYALRRCLPPEAVRELVADTLAAIEPAAPELPRPQGRA